MNEFSTPPNIGHIELNSYIQHEGMRMHPLWFLSVATRILRREKSDMIVQRNYLWQPQIKPHMSFREEKTDDRFTWAQCAISADKYYCKQPKKLSKENRRTGNQQMTAADMTMWMWEMHVWYKLRKVWTSGQFNILDHTTMKPKGFIHILFNWNQNLHPVRRFKGKQERKINGKFKTQNVA